MKKINPGYLLYLFLLPLFFVIHGFYENYEFIKVKDIIPLILTYWLETAVVLAINHLFTRNLPKATFITFLVFLMFFFFGWVQDFLKSYPAVRSLGKYSVLIPLWIIASIILGVYITRASSRLKRVVFFLNFLLIIYVCVDLSAIISKSSSGVKKVYSQQLAGVQLNATSNDPNIYLLLFDEYASSHSLMERFGFHNNLDSFLVTKNFRIQTNSKSNYFSTPLSVASLLDMNYLAGVKKHGQPQAEDFNIATLVMRDAKAVEFLQRRGYDIINYSIFDLKGHPASYDPFLLPISTKLISGRVLTARMFKHLGWHIYIRFPFFAHLALKGYVKNNEGSFQKTLEISNVPKKRPTFIYSHFMLPHSPFFFDKNGKRKPDELVFEELESESPQPYLEYVQYANTKIIELINAIRKNDPLAVIVLMGDHGYREPHPKDTVPSCFFDNLNAVYIPGSNSSRLYDSITCVNQFRMIFNEIFDQQIPKLEDKQVY